MARQSRGRTPKKRASAAGRAETFTASVKVAGINPFVDVPQRVLEALGGGKKAAVLVQVAGVGVGDRVRVTLKLDRGSRDLQVPDRLQDALAGDPEAKAAWDTLPPSRRREILTYLNFLKTPAALERSVQKTLADLASGRSHLKSG